MAKKQSIPFCSPGIGTSRFELVWVFIQMNFALHIISYVKIETMPGISLGIAARFTLDPCD